MSHTVHRLGLFVVTALVVIALSASSATAEEKKTTSSARSYWSMSFLGGLLSPLDDMKSSHKRGLAASGRLAWTSKIGLGLELATSYSPLPSDNLMELETVETHYVVSTLGPKFTLGKKKVRLWVSGGGGVAMDRSRKRFRDVLVEGGKSTEYAVATGASAGLDLHMLSSGGLTVGASYFEVHSPLEYKYVTATGGLVFTFK